MKLDLQENMYVRMKDGRIIKIKTLGNKEHILIRTINSRVEYLYNIIKASFNIIDILEVGDYVNGSIILGFENEYIEENDKFVPFGIITENCYLDNNDSWLTNKDIKSIVTHEQIEQISYKLGE